MSCPTRLFRTFEVPFLARRSGLYICWVCKGCQCIPSLRTRAGVPEPPGRRNSSSGSTPFAEKVRRKIWGTDNPPGLKDPYGGEGLLKKSLRERREAGNENPEEKPETEESVLAAAQESTPYSEDYVPATTWDGLAHVGTLDKWWEKPPTNQDRFLSFISLRKASTRPELLTILHQVMVELCIMQQLKKPLTRVCDVLEHDPENLALISQVEVKPSDDLSTGVLSFPSEEAETKLLTFFEEFDKIRNIPETELDTPATETTTEVEDSADDAVGSAGPSESAMSREPSTLDVIQPSESYVSQEPGNLEVTCPRNLRFLSISLEDPDFKFAFFKRTIQLTGHRIADPQLSSISTCSHLFKCLLDKSKPKPSKLADKLADDGRLLYLPNVKIMNRRQTPIDKEKEIGRWKVIEEELIKRNLPVTGRATAENYLSSN